MHTTEHNSVLLLC